MPVHHYRITVDKLDALDPATGEGGLESVSFFASTPDDILSAAKSLRDHFDYSACHATKLAVGLGLISEVVHTHHGHAFLHECVRAFPDSLQADERNRTT
jgi:hypothetical protein